MNSVEVARAMADRSGKTRDELSRDMGRSSSYVRALLARGSDLSTSTLSALADACGYQLIVAPRGSGEPFEVEPMDRG